MLYMSQRYYSTDLGLSSFLYTYLFYSLFFNIFKSHSSKDLVYKMSR